MTSKFDIAAVASGIKMIPSSAKAALPTAAGVTHTAGITINDFLLDKVNMTAGVDSQTYNLPTATEFKEYLGPNVFRKGLVIYQRVRNNSSTTQLNVGQTRGYANATALALEDDIETVLYLTVTSTIAEGDGADLITVAKFDDIEAD